MILTPEHSMEIQNSIGAGTNQEGVGGRSRGNKEKKKNKNKKRN